MATIIWSRNSNPTKGVATTLGIERWQLRNAIHKIKQRSGLNPADNVVIYDDGEVTDTAGAPIGNIYDEI